MSVIFVRMIESSLSPGEAVRHQLVEIALAAERLQGWAAAAQARAITALLHQFEAEHLPHEPRPVSAAEKCQAEERAARSTALSRTVHEGTLSLPGEPRHRLVDAVAGPAPTLLPDGVTLWSLPPHRLRPLLAAAVAPACPEQVADRSEVARSRRRVDHDASRVDRPGALVLHGPDELLAATFAGLDATARAARRRCSRDPRPAGLRPGGGRDHRRRARADREPARGGGRLARPTPGAAPRNDPGQHHHPGVVAVRPGRPPGGLAHPVRRRPAAGRGGPRPGPRRESGHLAPDPPPPDEPPF